MKFFSNSRGDIAIFLTLLSFGLMVTGALVGSQLVKIGPRINPQAATYVDWDWYSASGKCSDPATRSRTCGGIAYAACICCEISLANNDRDAGFCAPAGITNSGNSAQICQTNPWDTSWGCWKYKSSIRPPPPQPNTPTPTRSSGPPPPPGQPTVTPGQPPPPPPDGASCTMDPNLQTPDVGDTCGTCLIDDYKFNQFVSWGHGACTRRQMANHWCNGGLGQGGADNCNSDKAGACASACAAGPPPPPPPPPSANQCSDLSGTCIDSATCSADGYSIPVPDLPGCENQYPYVCCVEKIKIEKKVSGSLTFHYSDKTKISQLNPAAKVYLYYRDNANATWKYQTEFKLDYANIRSNYAIPYEVIGYKLKGEFAVFSFAKLSAGGTLNATIPVCGSGKKQQISTPNFYEACILPFTGGNADFDLNIDGTAPGVKPLVYPPGENIKINPKVLVVIYDYFLKSKNMPFRQYAQSKGWESHDPNVLISQFIQKTKEVSFGIVNYQIAKTTVDTTTIPVKADGWQYSEASFLACRENTGPCHHDVVNPSWNDLINYNRVFTDLNICSGVNANLYDEIWLFGPTYFGFLESTMAGPGAFEINGVIIAGTSCTRPVHVMGFNFERSVTEMLHDLGHRTESTLDKFIGVSPSSVWSQFKLNKYDNPTAGTFGCGVIHWSPNGISEYDHNNQSSVSSYCNDWLNYPNFKNVKSNVSCADWGCDGDNQLNYSEWWFKHLPHVAGSTSGIYNDWWRYIFNTVSTSGAGAPPVNTDTISGSVNIIDTVRKPYTLVRVDVFPGSTRLPPEKGGNIIGPVNPSTPFTGNKTGNYSFFGLTSGKNYTVKVQVFNNDVKIAEQSSYILTGKSHNFTIDLSQASAGNFTLPALGNDVWEAKINDYASGACDAICASKFVSETFLCHVPGLQKQTCDPNLGECQTFIPPCYFQDVGAI